MNNKLNMSSPFLLVILMFTLLIPVKSVYAAPIDSLGEAINQAGRQRMLTQRMLKNYALIGLAVRGRKSQDQLDAAINLYDQQLANLKSYSKDETTSQLLVEVDRLWGTVKGYYKEKPQLEKALELRGLNESLLAASHQVVIALEMQSPNKTGKLVNVAGRQRMLTQRMASSYALMAWGFPNELKSTYDTAYQQFSDALDLLMSSNSNSPEINAALKEVESQFKRFSSTSQAGDTVFVPGLIERSAEKMLVKMNEITGMYAKLEAK